MRTIAEQTGITVERQDMRLAPDASRVITRPFMFHTEPRIRLILDRIAGLTEVEVDHLCDELIRDYSYRHKGMHDILLNHYKEVKMYVENEETITENRRLLIGAYFTMEYAIESAALFNPSIVADPDQSGLQAGQKRVILSLRAVGEGHISSIEFRRGVLTSTGKLHLDSVNGFVATPRIRKDRQYDKHLFRVKIQAMGAPMPFPDHETSASQLGDEVLNGVLDQLDDHFTYDQLCEAIHNFQMQENFYQAYVNLLCERMMLLARSNYEVMFSEDSDISERVIFPVSHSENHGIEDARFVCFHDEEAERCLYLATYTAYDGQNILTHILETEDFLRFQVHTINGRFSNSKGMAFFPRRINGKYAMISRFDGENLYMMYSDNMHFWDEAELLRAPIHPWEFTQIGNCGSPIETEDGWLLITHGVGAMRRYCIGAMLLDLDDPTKVIGALDQPLMVPDVEEREGYVPNVVYTCGALIHNGKLILPYAVSDTAVRMATVPLDGLLATLKGV